MYIGKNIKYLRQDLKMTQSDLAGKIGKTKGSIVEYEKNRNYPPVSVLIQFAEIFEVSTDELINIDIEFARKQVELSANKKSNFLGKNINFLRKERGFKQTDLAKMIDKTSATIGGYEKGLSLPPIDIIIKLCQIFEVSIDDFVNKDLSIEKAEGKTIAVELNAPFNRTEPSDKEIIHLLRFKLAMYEKYIKENNPEWLKELGIE